MLRTIVAILVLAYFGQQFFDENLPGQECGSEFPPPDGLIIDEGLPDEPIELELEETPNPFYEENPIA